MRQFTVASSQLLNYGHSGAQKAHMRNIVLRSDKQFMALIGFELTLPFTTHIGFDYYGIVASDEKGVAVISTWVGRSKGVFHFFINRETRINPIVISSKEDEQSLKPQASFPPHWYQRIGLFI